MDAIWEWPLALVAFLVGLPAAKPLAARLLKGRFKPQALADEPDEIRLVRVSEARWRHDDARRAAEKQLAAAGFVECGVYVVREVTGLTIGLHAHVPERVYAVVYDHPRAGFWAEFVSRFTDGTLATFTTLEPTELDLPEGSLHVSAPKLSLAELWKKLLAERPKKAMLECVRARAAQDFERGYADSMAYHKRRVSAAARDAEDLRQAA